VLAWYHQRLQEGMHGRLDTHAQRLDRLAQRMTRPSERVAQQRQRLVSLGFLWRQGIHNKLQQENQRHKALEADLNQKFPHVLERQVQRLARAEVALASLDPRLVLQRGYAWLTDAEGQPVTQAAQTHSGQQVRASLADGEVELQVL